MQRPQRGRTSTALLRAVPVERIDDGVYLARRGRWRIVQVQHLWWVVTDSHGRYNDGHGIRVRTLYDGRLLIGGAEHSPEGRMIRAPHDGTARRDR